MNNNLCNLCDNKWACYMLRSLKHKCNRTYIGSTNSTKRRIRQHNREICGGAKSTLSMYPVEMFCIITGFTDHIMALRCEWLLKHPDGKKKVSKKYKGIEGRINGLINLLNLDKWNNIVGNTELTIWIKDAYGHLLNANKLKSNLKINIINDIWLMKNNIDKINKEINNDFALVETLLRDTQIN